MTPNKIINGLVYRFGNKYILLSFFTEKLYEIEEYQYSVIDGGNPLPETSIVLVNYEEIGKKKFITTPIVEYVLQMDSDGKTRKINAGFLSTDTIIRYAFKAAQRFIERKKENMQLNENIG